MNEYEVILSKHGFPRGFLRKSFEDISNNISKSTLEKVRRWYTNLVEGKMEKPWLYLYGGVGEWKTAIAVVLSKEMLRSNLQVKVAGSYHAYFWNCSMLFDLVRDFRDNNEAFSSGRWLDLLKAGLVVIDDFGTERETLFVFQKMQQLLDYRYSNNPLITIFTSNFSLKRLVDRIGDFGRKQNCEDDFLLIADRIVRRIKNQAVVVEFKK